MDESADERRERLSAQVPEWYRSVLQPHDAETAFLLGSYHVVHRGLRHSAFARAWFAVAAANAPVDMAWRIAEEYCQWGVRRHANEWMRYAIATEYPDQPGGIVVDPNLFALVVDYRGIVLCQDFGVQVASADNDRAERALAAAATRFMLVTADGRELADEDELDRLLEEGGDQDPNNYTPNFVSGPRPATAGPTMYCDCKDGTMPLMARTMIRILVEEVRAAGLDTAEIRPEPKPASQDR
jgi:hypothetical protein